MSIAQDIESRIQILDIVNRYVQTKKAGVNFKGLCPFHNEKSPSFIISPQKNIAHCFSCGKGGGPINFLMEIEKIDFREAITILAKEAGIELKTDYAREQKEKGGDVYMLYKKASAWYHDAIFVSENKHALEYLLHRGISLETIKKFQLGYSYSPRDLLFFLKHEGFETQFIIDSGLFLSETRDKFFSRIIFPIANSMGHVVAFTGRVLTDALPKYLNSPASHIFDKSSILYGLHLAKQSIAKSGEVFVVEGQMDTIALHQAGIDNVIGISGTALTKEHIRILKRFAKIIYLTLDSDNAGIKATFASIENLLNEDIEIRVIAIPNGKDPDEFTKNGGNFLALKDTSLSVIDFYLREGFREYDITTIIGKKKLIEKCLEIVVRLRSEIESDFYLQQIAKSVSVSMESLYAEYKKIKSKISYESKNAGFKLNQESEVGDKKNDNSKSFSPSLPDIIAGYIYRYQFLDLFFREFRYTNDDLTEVEDVALLMRLITDGLEDEDREYLKVLDLSLEEQNESNTKEHLERSFIDFIRKLHMFLLEKERQNRLASILPDDPLYLGIQTELMQKAKSLGLR
ncbi:DNA primase [Candidatus Gracilibacteria bacterium]|nr:DNA primase [Candidatus Gracilibacteria bacterium]